MCDVIGVASKADVIVNGYAFTKKEGNIQVLNLNRPDKAALFSPSGEMLETSMDDIELDIARNYWERNKRFMED